jgi:hypothetical protein
MEGERGKREDLHGGRRESEGRGERGKREDRELGRSKGRGRERGKRDNDGGS